MIPCGRPDRLQGLDAGREEIARAERDVGQLADEDQQFLRRLGQGA